MKQLKIETLMDFQFLANFQYAPNGKYGAFVKSNQDVDENMYRSTLWLLDTKSNEVKELTKEGNEKSFIWLDNETILFPSLRNKAHQNMLESGEELTAFYKLDIQSGEIHEAFVIPQTVTNIQKINDTKFLLEVRFDNSRPDLMGKTGEERELLLNRIRAERDYSVYDELPFAADGRGVVNKYRNRLYIYDAKTKDIFPITAPFFQTKSAVLNETKTKLVYVGCEYDSVDTILDAIYLYDILDGTTKELLPENELRVNYVEFLDRSLFVAAQRLEDFGEDGAPSFYLIDLPEDDEPSKIHLFLKNEYMIAFTMNSDVRYGGGINIKSYDGVVYFTMLIGTSTYIYSLDRYGNLTQITTKSGSVDRFDKYGDDIIFIGLRDSMPLELYKFNLTTKEETQLTHFNTALMEAYPPVPLEECNFINDNGDNIDGWVMKPLNYDPSKKYPGILSVHGGPRTAFGDVYFFEMQYFANQGYFVFLCNPTGSDGKGNQFANIKGHYGDRDFDDLMKFTDVVLERYPQIDKDRIGAMGGSYGGFMLNWIVGHTSRFSAAVSQRSISNFITMSTTSDWGHRFGKDQADATVWENFDRLWAQSPIKYADQATTPTLFIHSNEDYRCWMGEGIQMFSALKQNGVPARLCLFKGESHDLSRSGKPLHKMRRLQEMTDWFEKYLQ